MRIDLAKDSVLTPKDSYPRLSEGKNLANKMYLGRKAVIVFPANRRRFVSSYILPPLMVTFKKMYEFSLTPRSFGGKVKLETKIAQPIR